MRKNKISVYFCIHLKVVLHVGVKNGEKSFKCDVALVLKMIEVFLQPPCGSAAGE